MRLAIAGGSGTVGRHVVGVARERGHEVVVLSRKSGHDLEHGTGLSGALAGADSVIDVSGVLTVSARRARAFFTAVTTNLHAEERAVGVEHHVALSIVGIDGIDASYYAGKLAHERAVQDAGVPFTLVRTAQFHEFAEQMLRRGSIGRLVAVPKAPIRPIAAREVAARLVDLAEQKPAGRVRDLVGPRDERLVDMVRRMLQHDGVRRPVVELALPGTYFGSTASGVLRGDPAADRGTMDFEDWLRTDHAHGAHHA